MLGVRDEELLQKFDAAFASGGGQLLKHSFPESSVCNTAMAYARLGYVSENALEQIIKKVIREAEGYSFRSLALITSAFAKLDVMNPIMFEVLKNRVTYYAFEEDRRADFVELVAPSEAAQLLLAFTKAKVFDVPLMETLEHVVVARKEEATADTLLMAMGAHAAWGRHVARAALQKKQVSKRGYSYFRKYNDEFIKEMVTYMTRCIGDLNLKGITLVLRYCGISQLKKRDNSRLVLSFAREGVSRLLDERSSIGDPDMFELLCAKYFDLAQKFCLNKTHRHELVASFREYGIEIEPIMDKINPLEFSLAYEDATGKPNLKKREFKRTGIHTEEASEEESEKEEVDDATNAYTTSETSEELQEDKLAQTDEREVTEGEPLDDEDTQKKQERENTLN